MNRKNYLIITLISTLLLGLNSAFAEAEHSSSLSSKIEESIRNISEGTYQKKEELKENFNILLSNIDEKLQSLNESKNQYSEEAKAALNEKRAALQEKYDNLKNSTNQNWYALKKEFIEKYNEFENYLKDSFSSSSE